MIPTLSHIDFLENQKRVTLKAISRKFTLSRGVDLKICLEFLLGKEYPDSKNVDVLKAAESDNFKIVNYSLVPDIKC